MSMGVPAVGCQTGGVPEALGPGLLLLDPDDAERSAEEFRRWWTPERGEEGRRWARSHHGAQRLAESILLREEVQ